jgi:hypothetical protein
MYLPYPPLPDALASIGCGLLDPSKLVPPSNINVAKLVWKTSIRCSMWMSKRMRSCEALPSRVPTTLHPKTSNIHYAIASNTLATLKCARQLRRLVLLNIYWRSSQGCEHSHSSSRRPPRADLVLQSTSSCEYTNMTAQRSVCETRPPGRVCLHTHVHSSFIHHHVSLYSRVRGACIVGMSGCGSVTQCRYHARMRCCVNARLQTNEPCVRPLSILTLLSLCLPFSLPSQVPPRRPLQSTTVGGRIRRLSWFNPGSLRWPLRVWLRGSRTTRGIVRRGSVSRAGGSDGR